MERLLRVGIMEAPEINVTYHGDTFTLSGVTIGKQFHWQQQQDQTFQGELEILKKDDGTLVAVNIIDVETYLESVIASEMNPAAHIELLKAHAVISRSWVLAQKDVHEQYDVCADDHCQRYQGIPRHNARRAIEAVRQTRDMVLMADGEICDTRYSKCCGGVTEEFRYCWEDEDKTYLRGLIDYPDKSLYRPLHAEDAARQWIESRPKCFCNTTDKDILQQVLNPYDLDTPFFRWEVTIEQDELQQLLREKTSFDCGPILEMIPLERGTSGRISKLQIKAERGETIIGKELAIRRALSKSHLYSSAFVIKKEDGGAFTLTGAGWGHGVGLCQIGAAVMATKGYKYDDILRHYFPGAELKQIYTS